MPESPQTTQLRIARETIAAEQQAHEYDVIRSLVGDFKDVIVELIRTAQSNPLIGAALGMILANVLERLKVIDHNTGLAIDGVIIGAYGVDLAAEVVGEIASAVPSIGAKGAPSDPSKLVTPSATTLVYTESRSIEGAPSDDRLLALLSRLGVKGK